ncbi:unnamed protein product [Meganyctiphanes norvegica]|uniref:C-type lectin domain-containing protein n=1 Tax=Meganyctiphanes norvegica TaxID=48144 RepID=A0AAV2QFN7_MEGNR
MSCPGGKMIIYLCAILIHIVRISHQHELDNETLLEKMSQMISQQHELYSQTVLQNLNHMMDARLASLDIRINHIASVMNGIGLKQELKNQEIISKFSQLLQEKLSDTIQEVAANQSSNHQELVAKLTDLAENQSEYVDDNFSTVNTKLNLIESTLEEFTENIEAKVCGENLKSTSLLLQNEKNLITFNPEDLVLFVGQEASLYCGVIGEYSSCYWENNGAIYQIADVRNGVHLDLKEASNSSSINQCGIVIHKLRKSHYGMWNCTVLVAGTTITATKTITSDGANCVGGFIVGYQCLIFSEEALTWVAARDACASNGGRLASLADPAAVLAYVKKNYGGETFWAGGKYDAEEGIWKWLNGEPFDEQFPWASGEPSSGVVDGVSQHCVSMNYDGGFDNDWCNDNAKLRYVCEQM